MFAVVKIVDGTLKGWAIAIDEETMLLRLKALDLEALAERTKLALYADTQHYPVDLQDGYWLLRDYYATL